MSKIFRRLLPVALLNALCLLGVRSSAQTDGDAIMLKKNIFCAGAMYSYSSWTNYWEGTFKRDNLNLGRVSTEMYAIAGNYGITDRINFLFMAPYVKTNATAGTLHGMKGVQDLSLMLKWMAFSKRFDAHQRLSIYGVGRVSFPLTNYVVDYLPLSIGMRSKTAGLRAMVDYQRGKWFATASAAYTLRSNVSIDRTAYYDTEMHNTNQVDMPDMSGYSFRAGYRTNTWIAEGVVENMTTLGGFDIRKNDMPFPSNKMNQTQVGANVKYTMKKIRNLELTGGVRYVVAGRNVGQATTINGGIFYLMNFTGDRVNQTNIPKQ